MPEKSTHLDEIKISVLLRAARSALGLSQTELAEALGTSQSAIARCERGAGSLTANVLLRAIRYFKTYGVDISGVLETNPSIEISEDLFLSLLDRDRFSSENEKHPVKSQG